MIFFAHRSQQYWTFEEEEEEKTRIISFENSTKQQYTLNGIIFTYNNLICIHVE